MIALDRFYSGRTVCVTGGAGFIGSHLVEALSKRGAGVHIIDDLSNGSAANLRGIETRGRFVEDSVLNRTALETAIAECDIVFHEAALGSVPRSVREPRRFVEVNTMGTLAVLEAARRSPRQPRVVYASSSSVYGESPVLPRIETMTASPRSPYAAAKYAGELLLQSHCACYGLGGVSLRYFNVFGTRQRHDSAYAAVIPRFIDALCSGRSPVIHGDGLQSRDFTHVDNVVYANLLAGACSKPLRGEAINIACGASLTLLQLLDALGRLIGRVPQPRFDEARVGDVAHSVAAIDAARDLIGYQPVVGFEEGLWRTLAAQTSPFTQP